MSNELGRIEEYETLREKMLAPIRLFDMEVSCLT